MWVLTDHALQHGVQSTTRFRRATGSKKAAVNKTPAIQRQQSGAKGGRAARRAAKLKKHEESQRQGRTIYASQGEATPHSFSQNPRLLARDEWSSYSYNPPTPAEEVVFSATYALPGQLCGPNHAYAQEREARKQNEGFFDDEDYMWQTFSTAYNSIGKNGQL